jgi:hypothetical protein
VTIPSVEMELNPGQVVGLVERFGARARDFTPVLRGRFRATVSDFFLRQFATEGGAGGARWASLSPVTLQRRQRAGHNLGGVLWDTGRLRASLVKAPAPEGIEDITPFSYRRGTTVRYGVFLQTGSNRMPARPIIPEPLPATEQATWEQVLADWLTDGKA